MFSSLKSCFSFPGVCVRRSTLSVPPSSTAPSRAGLSPLSRPPVSASPCPPAQSGEAPRSMAWDSEHFMSLLPLPRPQARLSLQETRLSK